MFRSVARRFSVGAAALVLGLGVASAATAANAATGATASVDGAAPGLLQLMGADGAGELGNGYPLTNSSAPVTTLLAGLSATTDVSTGSSHVLGLLSNGTVASWGSDNEGELGQGTLGVLAPGPGSSRA